MVFRAGEGAGRSGSFFFFSHDNKFIIKTMSRSERELFLNKMQPSYENHLTNGKSLLAKILGVYTVKSRQLYDIDLMLMENTLKSSDVNVRVYDLKGSTVDRMSKKGILKDTNYKIWLKELKYENRLKTFLYRISFKFQVLQNVM